MGKLSRWFLHMVVFSLLSNYGTIISLIIFTDFSVFGLPRTLMVDFFLCLWSTSMLSIAGLLFLLVSWPCGSLLLMLVISFAFIGHALVLLIGYALMGYWILLYLSGLSAIGFLCFAVMQWMDIKKK